jgi:hypothetical protein
MHWHKGQREHGLFFPFLFYLADTPNYQPCTENSSDPYITLFLAYGDDESPSDVREYPIGRGSRVAPYDSLQHYLPNTDLQNFVTARGTLTENPDPHKSRPNTQSGGASTVLFESPEILQIPLGRYISEALSNAFTEEFRNYVAEYTWPFDLREFRTQLCKWHQMNR